MITIFYSHNDYAWQIRVNFLNQFDKFDFEDMNPYRQFMTSSAGVSHTDIKRMKEGHLGAQFWAIYTNCNSIYKDAMRIHMEQIDTIKRLIDKYSDAMEFVTTSDGICLTKFSDLTQLLAYKNMKLY